jgi:hypothetical protein
MEHKRIIYNFTISIVYWGGLIALWYYVFDELAKAL